MNLKDAPLSPQKTVANEVAMYAVMNVTRRRVEKTHGWFLGTIEDLDEAMWSWVSSPTAPSIGWHAWHTARVSDCIQAGFATEPARWLEPGYTEQEILPNEIWVIDSLADQWGLDRSQLGGSEAGINNNCSALLPGKALILPYVQRVLQAVEHAVFSLDEKRMLMGLQVQPGVILPIGADTEYSVAESVMFHISHTSRHLGMIEALRGVLGLQGSATN